MLHRMRNTQAGQLATLFVFALLAVAVEWLGGYHPPLRLTAGNLLRGVVGGVFGALVAGIAWLLLLKFTPVGAKQCLGGLRQTASSQSFALRAGNAVSTAGGEEFFLRGYVFGFLLWDSPLAAYLTTALITIALTFNGRRDLPFTTVRTVESLFYCGLFAVQHSITANAVARMIHISVAYAVIRSAAAETVLGRPLSWRMIYGIADQRRGAIRRV